MCLEVTFVFFIWCVCLGFRLLRFPGFWPRGFLASTSRLVLVDFLRCPGFETASRFLWLLGFLERHTARRGNRKEPIPGRKTERNNYVKKEREREGERGREREREKKAII